MDTRERLIARFNTARNAGNALGVVLNLLDQKKFLVGDVEYQIYRDSLIQRFEVAYDTIWKYLKEYLLDIHGIEVRSPRVVFQECYAQQICSKDDVDLLMKMIESRNITTHIYNESMAEAVSKDIRAYYQLLSVMLEHTAIE